MDQAEKGLAVRQSMSSKQCCIVGCFLVLTLSISLAALSLSAVVYLQLQAVSQSTGGDYEELVDPELDRATLLELEAMFEREDVMHFSHHPTEARSRRQLTAEQLRDPAVGCDSTNADPNEKPLAHIIWEGKSLSKIPDDRTSYSIITKDWVCAKVDKTQRVSNTHGRVRGGMVFNRTSGFLRLPKDGVYYVYSMVHFRGSSRDSHEDKKIVSKMVACIPDLDCNFPEIDPYIDFMHSQRRIVNAGRSDENNNFQGGLFHFRAGTQLALVVNNPKNRQTLAERTQRVDTLYLDGRRQLTYMGAFLVDKDHYNTTSQLH